MFDMGLKFKKKHTHRIQGGNERSLGHAEEE